MEENRWEEVRAIIRRPARRKSSREAFGDGDIEEVFYWPVLDDRPRGWATLLRELGQFILGGGRNSRLKELFLGELQPHGSFTFSRGSRLRRAVHNRQHRLHPSNASMGSH